MQRCSSGTTTTAGGKFEVRIITKCHEANLDISPRGF